MKPVPPLSRCIASLLVSGVVGAACTDVLAVDDVVGVWESTSINGDAVPGNVVIDGLRYDVEFWRWTFASGGLCSTTSRIESVEDTRGCEYTVFSQSKRVSIDFGFAAVEGVVDGSRMTVTDGVGNVFLLGKQ